MAYYYQHLW